MVKDAVKRDSEVDSYIMDQWLASGNDLLTDNFPQLSNVSAAAIFRFLPRPTKCTAPEYVYVPLGAESSSALLTAVCMWSLAWEAGDLRSEVLEDDLYKELAWLHRFEGQNLHLLPRIGHHRYHAYATLYHLLPRHLLQRFGLPCLRNGLWPRSNVWRPPEDLLPRDFDARLARAFASHIWPLLESGSHSSAFSSSEPIRLLAHNLDFWLPYADGVAQTRLRALGRVEPEGDDEDVMKRLRSELPGDVLVDKPLFGGSVWWGEDDAWEATRELVEEADTGGRLRGILDAVRSHRVEEDFSERWSFAREDFERKLYHKRNKTKVTFVELDDTIPVHGPDSEQEENILWEDFLALLDHRERRIVVLLRSGVTNLSEIGTALGYANHSPVSKALTAIREKARKYLA